MIIVIAIMAILIGVVALAVLPNIGRSRESKDLQALDNILASTNIALANLEVKTANPNGTKYEQKTNPSTDIDKVIGAVYKELGDVKLGSSNATGDIMIGWTAASNGAAPQVSVWLGTKGSEPACEYTEAAAGEPANSDGKRLYKVMSKAS